MKNSKVFPRPRQCETTLLVAGGTVTCMSPPTPVLGKGQEKEKGPENKEKEMAKNKLRRPQL